MSEKFLEEIVKELIKLNENIIKFLSWIEAKQPDYEYKTRVEESVVKADMMIQDFKGVTVMLETDKAYLVVKNGYQRWVAKSHLTDAYELGSNVDLKLTDSALKWVPEKPWDKYVPNKGG